MANYTRKDITGQRFGRLVAIRPTLQAVGQPSMWLFKCDCGQEVEADHSRVTHNGRGAKRSCGCLFKENLDKQHLARTTHGMSGTPIYRAYQLMIRRCHNPKWPDFAAYGGRGIYVCERWKQSFEHFYADMGDRPTGRSLDRIDNNGPYSPENCRWATTAEQARNKRNNKVIEYMGQRKCLVDWAIEMGVKPATLGWRLNQGIPFEQAIAMPGRTK